MVSGYSPGIAGVHESLGAAKALDLFLEINQKRSKATVESHHQQLLTGVGFFDGGEFFGVRQRGFSTNTCLPAARAC